MSTPDPRGVASHTSRRVRPDGQIEAPREDALVREEPLEIRVAGEVVAVTMRTPGDDHELALGFLFAEGLILRAGEVGKIAHCGSPLEEGWGNVIDVLPAPGRTLDGGLLERSLRGTWTSSACGVCGRRSIDDLLARIAPRTNTTPIEARLLAAAAAQLGLEQPVFEATGASHAALALSLDGAALARAEDVGRHNAVDKIVGALLAAGRLPEDPPALLAVSGRVSFEIVQKAAVAGIGAIVGISAPTSLAAELAARAGMVLAGFARSSGFNLYVGAERVLGAPPG
ncbi:MAG: formate dehydrogenase accessory sulfurtransferase FdhD [Myxococcales bacterium]|nr:formate dehydrogenase accessory sulfurtransferase FdhD [Myxococcales bacterium]